MISILFALIIIIALYRYIPSKKAIPKRVERYARTNEVASELNGNTSEEFKQEQKTYEITDSDLSMYTKEKSYNPGRVDPFADLNSGNQVSSNGNSAQNNSENSNNNNGLANQSTSVNSQNQTKDEKDSTDVYYKAANVNNGSGK